MQVLFIESKNLSPLRSTGKQGQRSREELEQQSKSEDIKGRNYVLTAKRRGLFEIYPLLGSVCCKKMLFCLNLVPLPELNTLCKRASFLRKWVVSKRKIEKWAQLNSFPPPAPTDFKCIGQKGSRQRPI